MRDALTAILTIADIVMQVVTGIIFVFVVIFAGQVLVSWVRGVRSIIHATDETKKIADDNTSDDNTS